MNTILKKFDPLYFMIGRALIGIYFLLPGISKIPTYAGTLEIMASKNVPFPELLLPLTIVLEIGLGLLLIIGKQVRISALLLFGLTIIINIFMHDFWALKGDPNYAHELQNFIKNLGIAGGLLVLAGAGKPQK